MPDCCCCYKTSQADVAKGFARPCLRSTAVPHPSLSGRMFLLPPGLSSLANSMQPKVSHDALPLHLYLLADCLSWNKSLTPFVAHPESTAAASGKARAKRSRWGPDQPATSSPPATGHAFLPASGFKGVTSHRPPGAMFSSRPGNCAVLAAAKQASEERGAGTQPAPAIPRLRDDSLTAVQPVAKATAENTVDEGAQRSAQVSAGQVRSSKDSQAGLVPGEGLRPSSIPHRSNLFSAPDRESMSARHRVAPAASGVAVPPEHMVPPLVESRHLEAHPRTKIRNETAHQEPAKHTSLKHTSHSDEYKHQRQHQEAEGRRRISPVISDGQRVRSREHRSSKGYWREDSEGRTSNLGETRDADRWMCWHTVGMTSQHFVSGPV